MSTTISRRAVLKLGAGTCVALISPHLGGCGEDERQQRSTVYAITGDELSELYEMAKQATRKLGITGGSMTGAKVFIKPNLVTLGLDVIMRGVVYNPAAGECTKPEIVAGIAEQCLEAGAARVTIGEGAQAKTWDWSKVGFLDGNTIEGIADLKTAVDRLKARYGDSKVELVCLNEADQWARVPSSSDDPLMQDGLMVARRFYEADHVVSCPCLKTHQLAAVTVAIKNYVGVTPVIHLGNGFLRDKLHRAYAHASCHGVSDAGIAGAYVDIHKWRMEEGREDFAIVDCSIGIEGDGPHSPPVTEGLTINLKERNKAGKYFLLASNDLAAADVVAAELMGFEVAEVKQFVMLKNLGLVAVRNSKLSGASIEDLAVSDWKKPVLRPEDVFFPSAGST